MAEIGNGEHDSRPDAEDSRNPKSGSNGSFAQNSTPAWWRSDSFQRTGFSQSAEILPPVQMPPTQPPRRRESSGRGWASAPATYVLLGINCAVYLAMCLSGASPLSPSSAQIVHWGGDFGPYVLLYGQWWRLISAAFVHIGLLHIATNMWCLWNLGLLGEPLLGVFGLFAAYLVTGYAGNLLSTAMHPGLLPNGADAIVGAGASGAIFGLAGVLIVLLSSKYLPLPKLERNQLRKSVIWFAVLSAFRRVYSGYLDGPVHGAPHRCAARHVPVSAQPCSGCCCPRTGAVERRNSLVLPHRIPYQLKSQAQVLYADTAELVAVANFLTIARSSFLSLSFKLEE
jgi:rhomboid protease GluP